MELRPEQLAGQGADTALAPVYLIAGPETLRVLEAADAVRARARAAGIDEREVFDADGRDFDWNQLDASFHAPSLFSARRLVEVRLPSGKPGKEGGEVISQFCANPAPDVILMITANEWSKAHQGKWAEAVNRVGVLSVAWAIKPHELSDWIERRLRSRGLRAEPAAVQRLAERVEGNLLAAAQEIDKLVLLADGQTLDVERMESLVADAARYDVFRLVEATFSGQPQAVLRMLAGLRGEGEAVANALGEFYPAEHAEFQTMMNKQKVSLPVGVCADLSDEQYQRLVAATVVHAKPLTNALGPNFRDVLTDERVTEIFRRM